MLSRGGFDLPVACDGLEIAIVSAQGDVEPYDSLARLDKVQVLVINASLVGSVVEKEFDLLEEARFVVLIELGAKLGRGRKCRKD